MNEYSPSFSVITGFPQIVTVSPPHIKFPWFALTFQTMPERFFIPENQSFEKIQADIRRLSYVSPNGMIYLMLGGSVYGIDLNSNEALAVARGLTEGGFAVSSDGSRFAWQDAGTIYGAEAVHVIDFNTAEKEENAHGLYGKGHGGGRHAAGLLRNGTGYGGGCKKGP